MVSVEISIHAAEDYITVGSLVAEEANVWSLWFSHYFFCCQNGMIYVAEFTGRSFNIIIVAVVLYLAITSSIKNVK